MVNPFGLHAAWMFLLLIYSLKALGKSQLNKSLLPSVYLRKTYLVFCSVSVEQTTYVEMCIVTAFGETSITFLRLDPRVAVLLTRIGKVFEIFFVLLLLLLLTSSTYR